MELMSCHSFKLGFFSLTAPSSLNGVIKVPIAQAGKVCFNFPLDIDVDTEREGWRLV